jgi:hypothetical protein
MKSVSLTMAYMLMCPHGCELNYMQSNEIREFDHGIYAYVHMVVSFRD